MKLRPGIRPGRRPLACYHEAGHAVARWWLGFHTDRVAVLSVTEVMDGMTIVNRRGVEFRGEGSCEGHDIHMPFSGDEWRSAAQRRAEMDMTFSYAGPFAEARYRKRSAFVCFLLGGDGDMDRARARALEFFETDKERNEAKARAEKVARALVRSPACWRAISRLAALLLAEGEVDGEEIDVICESEFGTDMRHDRWREEWPPTAAAIRSGYLPGAALPSEVVA